MGIKSDCIVRAITSDGLVSAVAVDLKNAVERARNIHKTLPLATAALGRTLAASSMIGAMLKGENSSVTLQIKGDGPLGSIVAVADSAGNVRGYLQNPAAEIPLRKSDGKLDVGAGVGSGTLTVIKDLDLKEPFSGCVELVGGEIAEDIAAYFYESEQIPTACALGVLVAPDQSVLSAGGYIIQLLPGAGDDIADRIERGVISAGNITGMLSQGLDPEEILIKVLNEFKVKILSSEDVSYRCSCSESKVSRAFISMGRDELLKLANERETVQATCQFCDRIYEFSSEQLVKLACSV